MKAIQDKDPNASFAFWGGEKMLEVSDGIVQHIRETSIMGFVEVARNISKILSFFKHAKATIQEFEPDVIIFIDYPGFNLRMAKWAKANGYKTVYYISPQLWAWKKGRLKTIQDCIDEMIVILPFEEDFYRENGVNVHYVGHPLVPVVDAFMNMPIKSSESSSKGVLAILPGSRKQEIAKMLPIMAKAALDFKKSFEVHLGMAPNIPTEYYEELLKEDANKVVLVRDGTYDLLRKADATLVTSGTATLETALFEVPQVVCYKTSWLNYQIGKRLVDLEFISLVNLIGKREIVPELIQDDVNVLNLISRLKDVIAKTNEFKSSYQHLKKVLKTNTSPSEKAAEIVLSLLQKA